MNDKQWTLNKAEEFARERIAENFSENGETSTSFDHYVPGDEDEGVPPKNTLRGALENLEREGVITIDAAYAEGFTVTITTYYQRELEER